MTTTHNQPERGEQGFAPWLLRFRFSVIAVIALLSALAAAGAMRVNFDADIEIWFVEDDPSLVTYHEFVDDFEVDEITVLALFAQDVFTPEILAAIRRITEAAGEARHVLRARSLTNVKVVESRGPAHASMGNLVDELPQTAREAQALRKRALGNVLVRDFVVSADGRVAAVLVEIDPAAANLDQKVHMVEALEAIAREHVPEGVAWELAGHPVLEKAFFDYTKRDFAVLGPGAALVAFLICLLIFRRAAAALLPLTVVLISNLWTFGMMGWLGMKVNMVSVSLFTVILAVGIADSVHVVTDFQREVSAGHGRDEAIIRTVAALLVPCFFTSITTVAGFMSLTASKLQPIGQFGLLASAGVMFAFVLSLTFAPIMLSLLRVDGALAARRRGSMYFDRLLDWLKRPSRRRSAIVVGVSSLLFAGAVASLGWLRVGANQVEYFHERDPARVAIERVDEGFGGSATYEFGIRTVDGGLKEPDVLDRMSDLERRIGELPAVTRVLSVLDSLREVRRVMTDGKPESATLPDNRPMAAQFYMMIEGDDDFRRNVKADYALTRMTATVKLSEIGALTEQRDGTQAWIDEEFTDERLTAKPTGFVKLAGDMQTYLLKSQIDSLSLAFVVVTLMLLLLLRSFKLMLLSLIPNVVPIVMGLSLMALLDIPLDPATVMIGSMTLGLVVDDTVHFLVRLRRNLEDGDLTYAIARSIEQTGHAIVYTTMILGAGLAVLMFGSFIPNASFGKVSSFVVLVALIADLVLLPAVLVLVMPTRLAKRGGSD